MSDNSLVLREDFGQLVTASLASVSANSKRVYLDTYTRWEAWANKNNVDRFDMNLFTVERFLRTQQVTITTRQRMLYAMRKIAGVLAVVDYNNPARQAAYTGLKMLKAPTEQIGGTERHKHVLSAEQVDTLLDVWSDADSLLNVRNHALISTMFSTGARRAELTAMRWQHVDLDRGTVYIPHGKRDKQRTIAIFGQFGINALDHWQAKTGSRQFVFCPMTEESEGAILGDDRAMTTDNLYRVVKQTGKRAGVTFSPHDARRALATDLLNNGMPLAEVQAQLGHSSAAVTMLYAQSSSAEQRRKDFDLSYG